MSTSPLEKSLDEQLAMLPLRERKKLKTRRAIQTHALRLFAEQGYDATTVEQIAEAAEVSPSTFFRYFATKEDVVLTDEYDPIIEQILREQPLELTPMQAIQAAMRQVLGELYESEKERIMDRTRLLLSIPALRTRTLDAMQAGTQGVLTKFVAERTGRQEDDYEIVVFGRVLSAALEASLTRWVESDARLDLTDLIDHTLDFVAAGCPL